MKNSFFLVIPPQIKNTERLKLYEEENLSQWLIDLPIANPGLATRLFHDFIKEFNTTEMDVQLRLDTLETIKPRFLDIEGYLRARLTQTGFPKGENDQKIMDVVVSIEKEFTLSYWIIVRTRTRSRSNIGWFQGKNTALALQRTIKGLGNIVTTYYMMCLPVPDWVWIDLHSLYKLSLRVNKEKTKVPDDLDKISATHSVTDTYMQILLLGLTNSAGLRQKEVQQTYDFLDEFSNLAKLVKKPINVQMLQCLVLLDEDSSPSFKHNYKDLESEKLYIDFTQLYKLMDQREKIVSETQERFNTINIASDTEHKLPSELIDYLEQQWIGNELQKTPSFSDRLDRYFTIGLENTYALLQHSNDEKNLQHELEFFAESSSEYGLSCNKPKDGFLAIGSLISFRKTDAPTNKRDLGVVNKIIIPKKKSAGIEFEVKLLATKIYVITYSLIKHNKAVHKPQNALLFAIKISNENQHFIIVNSYLLKTGNVVELNLPKNTFITKLVNKKNIGLGYWQFECERVSKNELEKSATKSNNEPQIKGYDFI